MAIPSLHEFIRELESTRTYFSLTSVREGAVMIEVALVDERWEIEFFEDRERQLEIYRSDGTIFGPEKLAELRVRIRS
ncbi:hypothetical protein [Sphingomonas segetis]|jgi:hypothetical protein|uniref:hypothetical protein n=1 Tax=Sphingomonas segetis TaxID=1104779 RepID=UPI0012D32233|nr:hypothetical protein [Sphingomonas segetis]